MTNLMPWAARTIVVTKFWASLCNLLGQITTQFVNAGITNMGLLRNSFVQSVCCPASYFISCPWRIFSWGRTRPWNSISFSASLIFHSLRSSCTARSCWRRWLKFSNLFNLTGGLIRVCSPRSRMTAKFPRMSSVKPVMRHSSGTRYTYSGSPDLRSLAFVRLISSGCSRSRIFTWYFCR